MALYNFHRVLITCAVLFNVFFALWSVRQWNATGLSVNLLMAGGFCAVTALLVAYLIHFNRVMMVQRPVARLAAPPTDRAVS